MSFTSVAQLLQSFLGSQHKWQTDLLARWPEIAGTLGTKVTIEKLYKETIVLGVQDSCWLQELYLLSPTLLHRINQTLDRPYLKRVRFKKLGILKKRTKKRTQKRSVTLVPYCITKREQQALYAIKNHQLRTALESFLMRCHGEQGHEKESSL